MKSALTKDILRTIRTERKRFCSIMLITALGVTVMTGLQAGCTDLRYSADALFDEQQLFDIQISSTLGLEDADIETLRGLDDVSAVEGEYAKTVTTDVAGVHEDVQMRTLGQEMNLPTIIEGTLPQAVDEVAVTEAYLHDTGKAIGDTVTISEGDLEEDEDPAFVNTEYTITAQVLDPFDANSKDGHVSFRSTGTAQYAFYVTADAVDSEIYTTVYLRVKDTADLMCYSDAYKDRIDAVQQEIDSDIKPAQQQRRYDTVHGDAMDEYTKARDEALQELDDGQQELDDAQQEIDDARQELDDAQQELDDARQEIEDGLAQIEESVQQMPGSEAMFAETRQQLEDSLQQLEEHQQEIDDGRQELEDNQQELDDAQQELDENRAEAMEELADAKAEVDDIEMAKWYIQDRNALSGYFNVDSDAGSIEGLATFLPAVFLILAILISLTTITRMVEEERGLIGTYKALGFTDAEICRKYMVYAAGASISGGILGDICGFMILPEILFTFFEIMYTIPEYLLRFEWGLGLVGIVLFTAGVLIAVGSAMRMQLRQTPATLMRPLAPQNGSRIFLEHITPIWSRMSFLNKVTARNIFRYKKRLIMTVIGIMGCTALLICGFAIKDTVGALMHLQYENVDRYNIMAVAQSADNDTLLSYMDDSENIAAYLNVEIDSVKIRNADGSEQTVQMVVIPDGTDLSEFIKLADADGQEIPLAADGVMLTHSASDVLEVYEGDELEVQDLAWNVATFRVAAVTEYYLGNMLYVSQSAYEAAFDEEYTPNAVLVNLTESCKADDPITYADQLGRKDGILSTVSVDSLKAEFSTAFQLMNLVVYVLLVLAAALSFVVLFTLSTTNISERCRELATIKVLGFYDREVHSYVNKETMILSLIGIVLGIPAGKALSGCLTWALKIPGLYFAVSIETRSYVICAAIAFAFTIIVNLITNRMLNVIDPVEALKSVE